MKGDNIRKAVREGYSKIAEQAEQSTSCCDAVASCCGNVQQSLSKRMGYTEDQLLSLPEGADLSLGCGNPTALASLKEGETVLDLGSGAGIDCFLASAAVGKTGKVIGVDMTPTMLEKARSNAEKGEFTNVEFRLGEIENLPIADDSIDVVISNCVINLSPDKKQVFSEVYRVLKPGGRIMISDIVLIKELPDSIRSSISALVACVAGADIREIYLATIESAGFKNVEIVEEVSAAGLYSEATTQFVAGDLGISANDFTEAAKSMSSIKVSAIKL